MQIYEGSYRWRWLGVAESRFKWKVTKLLVWEEKLTDFLKRCSVMKLTWLVHTTFLEAYWL